MNTVVSSFLFALAYRFAAAQQSERHATHRNDAGDRTDGDIPGARAAGIRSRGQIRDRLTASSGERWKAQMARGYVPAPYAAPPMLRAPWYASAHSWTRLALSPQMASKPADYDG
jgi:hypothetical protein